jgi:hypothetical protein
VLIGLAVAALFLSQVNAPAPEISIQNDEVWIRVGSQDQQLTHNRAPKRLPLMSPDGKSIAYVLDLPRPRTGNNQDTGAAEAVVQIDLTGKEIQRIIPRGYLPKQFDRLDWIDDHRLGAMLCGAANCFYWILDTETAATLQIMEGGYDFLWSHNRRWVARRKVSEFGGHDDIPPDELDTLLLNDTEIYPLPDGEDMIAFRKPPAHVPPHGHVFSELAWSPDDSWVGFADVQSPEDDVYVVLASPEGRVLRRKVPNPVAPIVDGTVVDWLDEAHIRLTTPGQIVVFALDGDDLRPDDSLPR